MRFLCDDCGCRFDEDEAEVRKYVDIVPYGDQEIPLETEEIRCPKCGSEDYEIIRK